LPASGRHYHLLRPPEPLRGPDLQRHQQRDDQQRQQQPEVHAGHHAVDLRLHQPQHTTGVQQLIHMHGQRFTHHLGFQAEGAGLVHQRVFHHAPQQAFAHLADHPTGAACQRAVAKTIKTGQGMFAEVGRSDGIGHVTHRSLAAQGLTHARIVQRVGEAFAPAFHQGLQVRLEMIELLEQRAMRTGGEAQLQPEEGGGQRQHHHVAGQQPVMPALAPLQPTTVMQPAPAEDAQHQAK